MPIHLLSQANMINSNHKQGANVTKREEARRYRAFFSYSRADSQLAAKLHRALDTYKVPKALRGIDGSRGKVPITLHPIFRDREDLSGGGELADRLKSALLDSDSLIVLCTKNSAQSQWVNEEIKTFQAMGREDDIFPVIGDGDPSSADPSLNCLPPALDENLVLAADLRDFQESDGRIVGDGFAGGKLKLISGMLGVELDQLRRREETRRRKQMVFAGVASIVFLALAIMSAVFGFQADRNAKEAQSQRLLAEANAERALRGESLAQKRAEAEVLARNAEERERKRADSERERAERNAMEAYANAQEAQKQAEIARASQRFAEAETARAQYALAQAVTQGARLALGQGREDTALRMALASGRISPKIDQEQRVLLARLTANPKPVKQYKVPASDEVTFLAVSPDGSHVMTSGLGLTARLYDVLGTREVVALGRNGTDRRRARARTGAVRGSVGASARETRSQREVGQTRGLVGNSRGLVGGRRGNRGPVGSAGEALGGTRLANNWFSRDGQLYLNTFEDGSFEVRNTSDGRLTMRPIRGHRKAVLSASFNPLDNRIATSSLDNEARIWRFAGSRYIATTKLVVPGLRSAAWSQDGEKIITMSIENGLQVWQNGRSQGQISNSSRNSGALAIGANDKQAIEIDDGGVVRLTELSSGELKAVLKTADVAPGAFVISTDSKLAIIGRNDGRVVVWDIETRQQLANFEAHHTRVAALAISQNNQVLASATNIGEVKLWSLEPLYAPLMTLVTNVCSNRVNGFFRFTSDEKAADPLVAALPNRALCNN
jgi:WD40 repeat protein